MADIAKWRPLKRQDSAGKLSLVAGLVQKLKHSYFEYIAHSTGRPCTDNEGIDLFDKVSQHLSTPFTPSTPAECSLEEVRHWAFVSSLAEVSYAADLQHLETDLDGILGPENIEYSIVTAQFAQDVLLKAYYVLALPKLRRLFVVIRGSKEVDDCLEILHAEPLDTLTPTGADCACKDIAAAASVLTQDAQLTACIDSLGYDVITIVGHSLGGLTAAAVVQNLREKVKALSNPTRLRGITFGCPAVFSKALSESLPELISFVHTDDLMPRLSLPALASLFQPAQSDPDSAVRPAILDDDRSRDTSLSSSDDDVTIDPSKPVIVPPSADSVTAMAQPSPSESSLSISSSSVSSAINTRSSSVGSDDAKLVSSADAFRLPGRVLHLGKLASSTAKGPVYGLFSLDSEALEIKLSPTMLEDHKVKSYVQALRGLEALLDKEPGDQ